jgi:trigger factor
MDSSRPEAEQRLRRSLALRALAEAEDIHADAAAIDAKVKEVSAGLSDTSAIDPERLREAVAEDLLRETLLDWLEANSTLTEKAPLSSTEDSEDDASAAATAATDTTA